MTQVSLPPDLDFAVDPAATPDRMNRAMANLQLRIAALEVYRPNFDALFAQLQQIGLSRLNDALLPIYNEIAGIADLGAIFSANSTSSVVVAVGDATFVIASASRASFAPAAWVAAVAADSSAALVGQTVSFDRTSGELVMNVTYVYGAGTISSWVISPSAPPVLMVAVVEGGTF